MHQSAIDQLTNNESNSLPISFDDVSQMATELFQSMLGLPFDPEPRSRLEDSIDDAIQSTIHITGDWNIEFQIIAPNDLASTIGCAMFDLSPGEIAENEVFDALGEVANVIGGNAKGNVGGECSLSLPTTVKYEGSVRTAHTLVFNCNKSPLVIRMIEA